MRVQVQGLPCLTSNPPHPYLLHLPPSMLLQCPYSSRSLPGRPWMGKGCTSDAPACLLSSGDSLVWAWRGRALCKGLPPQPASTWLKMYCTLCLMCIGRV